MKIHITTNEKIKEIIKKGLKENDGYCPCVVNSRNNERYKCMCENFRLETPAGQYCHCGLYFKDEI